jgi:hypothetical protein
MFLIETIIFFFIFLAQIDLGFRSVRSQAGLDFRFRDKKIGRFT